MRKALVGVAIVCRESNRKCEVVGTVSLICSFQCSLGVGHVLWCGNGSLGLDDHVVARFHMKLSGSSLDYTATIIPMARTAMAYSDLFILSCSLKSSKVAPVNNNFLRSRLLRSKRLINLTGVHPYGSYIVTNRTCNKGLP